jgi:acetyl-CoA carboxylase biotin carboxyl carrier protein
MARQSVEAEVGGMVSKIELREGERVARDQLIMMIELMKMEIPIAAPVDGTLVQLLVAEGDMVTEGQEVAILETA